MLGYIVNPMSFLFHIAHFHRDFWGACYWHPPPSYIHELQYENTELLTDFLRYEDQRLLHLGVDSILMVMDYEKL